MKELVELQLTSNLQGQPWPTKLLAVLNSNSRCIDFDPLRLSRYVVDLIKQRQLLMVVHAPWALGVRLTRVTGCLLYTQPACFVKLAQPRNNSLSWAGIRAIRFNQRPVRMPLAVFFSKALSNEHDCTCYRPTRFATEQRSSLQRDSESTCTTCVQTPPTRTNLRRSRPQNIPEKAVSLHYWGTWANTESTS